MYVKLSCSVNLQNFCIIFSLCNRVVDLVYCKPIKDL
jgi:hypothetical protein